MVTVLENTAGPQPERARPHEASAAMEFVLGELRSNPDLSFPEVKERAHQNGFEVFPILYGRAKKLLGLATGKLPAPRVGESQPTTGAAKIETAPTAGSVRPTPEPTARRRGRSLGPEMMFAVAALEKNPHASNAQVNAEAAKAGVTVTAQVMLRARARLGLPGHREAGRTAAAGTSVGEPTPAPTTAPRRSSRPRSRSVPGSAVAFLDLESLVASIREIEEERDRLRDALERIVKIVEELV